MTVSCEEFVVSEEQKITKSGEVITLFFSSKHLRIELAHLRINAQGRGTAPALFEGHFNY